MGRSGFSVAVILLVVNVSACSYEPQKFGFYTVISGGPQGWPVWVEDLTFDHSWGVPAGVIEYGIEEIPPRGGVAIIDPKAVPQSVQAKWFSYRTQTYYEVNLELPPDINERVNDWYKQYPEPRYHHSFITGFSGKGEVVVWWRARCSDCGRDRSEDFSTPIIRLAMGEEFKPDQIGHKAQTQQLVDEGVIPSPW